MILKAKNCPMGIYTQCISGEFDSIFSRSFLKIKFFRFWQKNGADQSLNFTQDPQESFFPVAGDADGLAIVQYDIASIASDEFADVIEVNQE